MRELISHRHDKAPDDAEVLKILEETQYFALTGTAALNR